MDAVTLPAAVVPVIKAKAQAHRLDPALLGAFVWQETRGRPFATRYEPASGHYVTDAARWAQLTGMSMVTETIGQMTSWGLIQVMGFKARELGFKGMLPELCQPDLGLELGCCLLKHLAVLYGQPSGEALQTFEEPVAASYNAGSARRDAEGNWVNVSYVTGVRTAFLALKEGF